MTAMRRASIIIFSALLLGCSGQGMNATPGAGQASPTPVAASGVSTVHFGVDIGTGGSWSFSDRPGEVYPPDFTRQVSGVIQATFEPAAGLLFVGFQGADSASGRSATVSGDGASRAVIAEVTPGGAG